MPSMVSFDSLIHRIIVIITEKNRTSFSVQKLNNILLNFPKIEKKITMKTGKQFEFNGKRIWKLVGFTGEFIALDGYFRAEE